MHQDVLRIGMVSGAFDSLIISARQLALSYDPGLSTTINRKWLMEAIEQRHKEVSFLIAGQVSILTGRLTVTRDENDSRLGVGLVSVQNRSGVEMPIKVERIARLWETAAGAVDPISTERFLKDPFFPTPRCFSTIRKTKD
jgi:hypothetical protein